MKSILIHSVVESIQDPKAATAILVGGATAGTGTALEWLPAAVGLGASIVSIIAAFIILYFHWRRNQREDNKEKRKKEIDSIEMEERMLRVEKLRSENNAPKQK